MFEVQLSEEMSGARMWSSKLPLDATGHQFQNNASRRATPNSAQDCSSRSQRRGRPAFGVNFDISQVGWEHFNPP
jgi:hypothetical protein